jgi:hypothetical protein
VRDLEEYETLKNYLKLKLQHPISAPKVITVIADGVKYIEHYRDLSGPEKKDMVIRSMRDVIQEADFIPDGKTILIGVIDTFADDTIECLVDFGKHMYLKVKKGYCKK